MPCSQTPVVTCTLAITHSGLLPSSAYKLSAFPRNLSIMSLSCCPQLYIFRGSITRPAFLFRPASDSPHRVCPRTSLLTCWLNFSQVGLSHYAITHWVTSSNFIPLNRNPNDSDLSGHEHVIVMQSFRFTLIFSYLLPIANNDSLMLLVYMPLIPLLQSTYIQNQLEQPSLHFVIFVKP